MAGSAIHVTIDIPGLKETVNLMRSDDLSAEPLREGMEAIGQLGQDYATLGAPMLTGRTIAKLQHKVQAKAIPGYVVIKTTAKNPRTHYGYPRLLEYAPKWGHAGWFTTSVGRSQSAWGPIFARIGEAIGRNWSD